MQTEKPAKTQISSATTESVSQLLFGPIHVGKPNHLSGEIPVES